MAKDFGRNLFGPNLEGFADRAIARALGRDRPEVEIDEIPFDEADAELQAQQRRFHSNAPTGADYSADYLNDTRRNAMKALADPDADWTDEELRRLQHIAATGEAPEPDTQGFWTGVLDLLDVPGRLIRLAVADAFQLDKKQGVEIGGDAYLSALNPFDNPNDLAKILGEEFVGEDGRFSGSKLLEAAGWDPDKDKPGWSGFGRWLADFGAEIVLDPLTYVGFALGGLGKKFAVEATTHAVKKALTQAAGGAIDEVLERVARGNIDNLAEWSARKVAQEAAGEAAPEFVQRLEREILEEAREVFRKKVDEIGGVEEFNKLDAHLNFKIKEEVVEEAYNKVAADTLNDIGRKVVDKRFDELPQDFVTFVRNDPTLDNRILGGLRLNIPRLVGGGGAKNSVGRVLPGGARRAKEAITKLPGLRKLYDSRIARATRETFEDLGKKFASEQADIVAARNGHLWEHMESLRRMEKRLVKAGVHEVGPRLHAAATALERVAKEAGENHDDVVRKIFDRMEEDAVGVAPLFASKELNEAAAEFAAEAKRGMAQLHSALKELDPSLGHIQGYVPRTTTLRGRKALEFLAEKISDPSSISGNTRGHQMLRALLADVQRNAARRGGKALGEATYTRSRELFSSAVVMLDDAGHAMLSPDIARGYASIGELNDDLGKAIRDVIEQERLTLKVDDSFKVWEDDPQKILSTYFEGMEQALRERALVKEWESVGLIRKESRETDMWRTIDKIREQLNDQGDRLGLRSRMVKRYEELENTVKQADRILSGAEDLPRKTVSLGEGVTIDLPEAVVEMPRVQRAIGRAQEKLAQAAKVRNEIVAAQRSYYNSLLEKGVGEPLARRLSLATPSEVHKVAAETWAAAIRDVNDELDYMLNLLARDYANNKDYINDLRQLAMDRAQRQRKAVKDGLKELDDQWKAQFLDEIDPDSVTNIRYTMTPQDMQELAARAEQHLATNTDALLNGMDLPPKVLDDIREVFEMAGNDPLAVQFGLQRFVDLNQGARATVNLFERLEEFADFPAIAEVLGSRRFQAIYKRAQNWLQNPSIRSADERMEELWAEFMFPDEFAVFATEVHPILASDKFMKAVGSYLVADIIDDISPAAARTLAENDGTFRRILDDALKNARQRDADTVAQETLEDHLKQLGIAEAGIFKAVAEDAIEAATRHLFRHETTIPLLRRAAFDPAIMRTATFGESVARLMADLGMDPNLIAFSDEGIHLLEETVEEVADFATLDEILEAIQKVGAESFSSLTADQAAKLPDRIKYALNTEGVPDHILQHEELMQWYAAAKRNSAQGGTMRRHLNKVAASERVWRDDVLPELRKVLSGKRKVTTLRQKLYVQDAKTGKLIITDLGRTLKAGMPDGHWDRLKTQLDYLELAANPKAPRALLAANKRLLEGTAFQPFSKAFTKLQNMAEEVAAQLTERERQEAADTLSMLGELRRILEEEIMPRAMIDRGPGVRPELPELLFGDEAFKRAVADARKLAKRLGLDADLTLEQTTVKQAGFSPLSSAGVAGEIVAGRVGTETTRIVMRNMVDNYRALNTPEGLENFGRGMRAVVSFWKGMVTVTRPTFHLRNLVGGVWNNQIADVRLSDYAFVARHAPGFLRDIRKGRGLEGALKRLPNDNVREVFRAMVNSKVLENSFARREFGQIGSRHAGLFRTLSPISGDPNEFFLVQGGALAMESIEGFMRAAAFARHYTIGDPSSARVAASIVNAVHFDYSDLSQAERWVKQVSPFFVWTRRNIPLQLRTLIERPGIMARYQSLMESLDYDGDLPQDQFPVSAWLSPFTAKTNIVFGEGTPFWARVLIDPDIPSANLLEIDPLSPGSWVNFLVSNIGPQITLPMDLMDQAEFGSVNAPAGLAEILKLAGMTQTTDGDVRIPYWQRTLFENVFPFYREFVEPISPRDPRRAQRLGVDTSDGIQAGERVAAILARLAGAGGVSMQTPADAPSRAFEANEAILDAQKTARLEGRIAEPSPEDEGFDLEAFLASLDN